MTGRKIVFSNLGDILKGIVLSEKEDMVLVQVRRKNYLIDKSKILRVLF